MFLKENNKTGQFNCKFLLSVTPFDLKVFMIFSLRLVYTLRLIKKSAVKYE
jgi:hypothetical protein